MHRSGRGGVRCSVPLLAVDRTDGDAPKNKCGEMAVDMDKQRNRCGCNVRGAAIGDLPREAAIGMAYTPMQRVGSDMYDPLAALSRGTLFPGLELPLGNRYNVHHLEATPLRELQAVDFAIVELVEYLDTHAGDTEAYALLEQYHAAYKQMREAYVKRYGPLSKYDLTGANRYQWINDPWPWEYCANGGKN